MRNYWIGKLARSRKRLMYFLLLSGGILGAIGSYLYYGSQLSGWRLWLSVLFSTIKLYFFAPTIGLTEKYSVYYEIAKWLSPLGSLLGIVNAFGVLWHQLSYIRKSLFAKRYLVFGEDESAYRLLRNLIRENNGVGAMIAGSDCPYERSFLIGKGIRRLSPDLSRDPSALLREELGGRGDCVVIFFGEDIENFKNIRLFHDRVLPLPGRCHMVLRSRSHLLQAMMERSIDSMKRAEISFFNMEDAVAGQLMAALCRREELFRKEADPSDAADFETLCGGIGSLHVLILGFGRLGEAVLLAALNSLVCNPMENNHFTIADREIEKRLSELTAEYPFLGKTAELHALTADILGRDFLSLIEEADRRRRIDIVVFSLGELSDNLILMERLKELFRGRVAALRIGDPESFSAFFENFSGYYGALIPFGIESRVLNTQCVLEDQRREAAMDFNARYHTLSSEIVSKEGAKGSRRELWEGLSLLKKDSCMSQMLHKEMKERILLHFLPGEEKEKLLLQMLRDWERKLQSLSPSKMTEEIERDPRMCFMAALEHKRWCNFYYLKGFRYSEKKDEEARTHDCLIPDWAEFLRSDKRDTIVYDLLASLSIRE